jgi:hypothetical protein
MVDKKKMNTGAYNLTCFTKSGAEWKAYGSFTISFTEESNRLIVATHLELFNSDKKWVDTSISDANTLKPVYRSSITPDRRTILRFGKEVTGYYKDASIPQKNILEPLANDFFESYTYPYLLSALPLKAGYRASLSVYEYVPGQSSNTKKAIITSVTSNTLNSEFSGEHKVWQVSVVEEKTNDLYEYYIDKEGGRLWKIEVISKGQHTLMVDSERDYNPLPVFDKQSTMTMITAGNAVIEGQAFARDNQNEGMLKGMAVLNINKKQFAPQGTRIVLIPYTAYFKAWIKLNESLRKKGKSYPLQADAAASIKTATVYDDRGSFEFVNLMPGDYLLFTEFGYVHTSSRTEVVGYTDTYINGTFQGSSANTATYSFSGNAAAAVKKLITIKQDGEKLKVKLKKTL